MTTFGARLKILRIQAGLSQQEVSDGIPEISQTYLSALENRALAPRQEVLDSLNSYYGVTETYWHDGKLEVIAPNEDVLIKLMRWKKFDKAIELIELMRAIEAIKAEEEVE